MDYGKYVRESGHDVRDNNLVHNRYRKSLGNYVKQVYVFVCVYT